jgi:hypothetical protein
VRNAASRASETHAALPTWPLSGRPLYLRAVCCRPIMLNCAFCSALSEL